jgi:hypothetical protein
MLRTQQVFRVFVSSSFRDMRAERSALHAIVFPRIAAFCRERSCIFEPIDLRWGISRDAANEHKTVEVCLEEARACRNTSHGFHHLTLLGDGYGLALSEILYLLARLQIKRSCVVVVRQIRLKTL